MKVLVVNAGSSSLKYQLFDTVTEAVLAKGICERIGLDGRIEHKLSNGDKIKKEIPMPDHAVATGIVIDYLTDMTIYEEAEVKGKKYLLVHAGIAGFKKGIDLESLKPKAFFSEPLDLTKKYFDDVTIIVGHVPTTEDNGGDGRIFYGNGSIAIDCGEARGGTIGCLRLDDMKEFYV